MLLDYIKSLGYIIFNYVIRMFLFMLRVFPIKNNYILVNCYYGKSYGDNPKYIIESLRKLSSDFVCIWLSNSYDNPCVKNVKFIQYNSFKAFYYQAVTKIWISTVRMPYYSVKRKGQIYIQTWHGSLSMKKIEQECENSLNKRYVMMAKNDSRLIDYYISSNRDMSNFFVTNFWYDGGEVLEVGAPRNSVFFSSIDTVAIKKKLNFDKKKIILYAPTFRKSKTFEAYRLDYRNIIEACKSKFGEDWIVVVRLHPAIESVSNKFIEFNEFIRNGSQIQDVQELLSVTDVLITDYSSIAFDYMLRKKPIFIFSLDIDEYRKDRNFHIELDSLPFSIAVNNKELVCNISSYDERKYIERLEEFMNRYGVKDNIDSAKSIAELINSKCNL